MTLVSEKRIQIVAHLSMVTTEVGVLSEANAVVIIRNPHSVYGNP